jgi:hypothetical protein
MYVNGEAILRLLTDINDLWNREGFGSDDRESEPLKARLERAISELSGDDE